MVDKNELVLDFKKVKVKSFSFKDLADTAIFLFLASCLSFSVLPFDFINSFQNKNFSIIKYSFTISLFLFIFSKILSVIFKRGVILISGLLVIYLILLANIIVSFTLLINGTLNFIALLFFSSIIILLLYSIYILLNYNKTAYFNELIKNEIIDGVKYRFHAFHPMSKKKSPVYSFLFKLFYLLYVVYIIFGLIVLLYFLFSFGFNSGEWSSSIALNCTLFLFFPLISLVALLQGVLFLSCDLIAVIEQEKRIGKPIMIK